MIEDQYLLGPRDGKRSARRGIIHTEMEVRFAGAAAVNDLR